MNSSSTICRDLIDTKNVIESQLAEILLSALVSSEKITRDECKTLSGHLNKCIDTQVNSLIDRILNELK